MGEGEGVRGEGFCRNELTFFVAYDGNLSLLIIIIIIHKLIGRPDLTGLAHRGANTARQSGRFLYGKMSLSKTLAR